MRSRRFSNATTHCLRSKLPRTRNDALVAGDNDLRANVTRELYERPPLVIRRSVPAERGWMPHANWDRRRGRKLFLPTSRSFFADNRGRSIRQSEPEVPPRVDATLR